MKKRIYSFLIKVLTVVAIGIVCFYKQSFFEILMLSSVLGVIALMIICSICDSYKEDLYERVDQMVESRVEEEIENTEYRVRQQIIFHGFK